MTTFHRIDRYRGRANTRCIWTACGKAARACGVLYASVGHVNCSACLVPHIGAVPTPTMRAALLYLRDCRSGRQVENSMPRGWYKTMLRCEARRWVNRPEGAWQITDAGRAALEREAK